MTRGGFRVEHPIGPDGLLVLRVRDGDVRIRGIKGTTATVEARDGDDAASLAVERGPAGLTVSADRGVATPDLDVDVPLNATILVEAASSDIRAERTTGQQRYHTTSGDVQLRDVDGDLTVEVVSGDVVIGTGTSASIAARTVSGDLAIRAIALATLRASTTSGDLIIDAGFAGGGPYTVETVSGDADLRSRGPVRVETTTLTGAVWSDGDVVAEGPGNGRILTAGRGGPTVRFRSTSGDLHLDAREADTESLVSAAPAAPAPPEPPMPPEPPAAPEPPVPADDPTLAVLRALERGEIDPAEAARRLDLQGADHA